MTKKTFIPIKQILTLIYLKETFMKILTCGLMLATLLAAQPLFAHSDHSQEPVSEAATLEIAADVANHLSSRDAGLGFGQLPTSWASIPKKNIAIHKKGEGYYIISLLNDSEKKTLYVLMSDSGEVYDANFTGKFEGVD